MINSNFYENTNLCYFYHKISTETPIKTKQETFRSRLWGRDKRRRLVSPAGDTMRRSWCRLLATWHGGGGVACWRHARGRPVSPDGDIAWMSWYSLLATGHGGAGVTCWRHEMDSVVSPAGDMGNRGWSRCLMAISSSGDGVVVFPRYEQESWCHRLMATWNGECGIMSPHGDKAGDVLMWPYGDKEERGLDDEKLGCNGFSFYHIFESRC